MKILGLLLSLVFLYIFIKQDQKEWPRYSLILWLPLTWLLITSTRLLQILFPSPAALDTYDAIGAYFEGNPRNRIILLSMIILGLILFVKKKVSFNEVFKQNAWLFLLYFFAFISIGWSNHPYVSFKRWITIFGSLVMALLIIFQDDHEEAIEHFIRRYAAIFLVISTFLFKFYEQIGFVTQRHGTKVWAGLATHKNALGMLCSFFIVFLIWRILKLRPTIIFYDVVLVIISTWLLIRAGSVTAYILTGIGLLLLIGMIIS